MDTLYTLFDALRALVWMIIADTWIAKQYRRTQTARALAVIAQTQGDSPFVGIRIPVKPGQTHRAARAAVLGDFQYTFVIVGKPGARMYRFANVNRVPVRDVRFPKPFDQDFVVRYEPTR